jgi:O-antigen/teichoic acid export membrane protein
MSSQIAPRVDGQLLLRNVGWNFLGTVAPLLAAVYAIPLLITGMGTARFGVFSLAWVIVGYFGFFDLGLGRAVTRLVAERVGTPKATEIPRLFWTATIYMATLGVVAAGVVAAMSPWLANGPLKVPPELRQETEVALYVLAASIPAVILSTGLRGFLEAYQRFALATALRVPIGILSFVGPLGILPFSNSLPAMVLVLACVRMASCVLHAAACWHQYPALRRRTGIDRVQAGRLLSFGGWMTISNVVGPLLLYLGRFLIAVQLSAEAVAYFSTPYEIVSQLLIIPVVAVGVLFPAFSQLSQAEPVRARKLYGRALVSLATIMLPSVGLVWLLAKAGLTIWINEEFAENSFRVAQILAGGVLLNSFGLISQALVQAFGRPDLTAKLHIMELILYVPYLIWLTGFLGIEGAAIAWVVRVSISTAALLYLANRCLSDKMRASGEVVRT